ATVTSKKDRHLITAGSLPSIVLIPQVRRRARLRLTETTAALRRSSGRTAIVGVREARRIAADDTAN
ncbi:MAG: hypothetical protein WA728_06420, partial [Xanthobacteraceae bacterium]